MIRRLNHELVLSLLPDRNPWGHKGNFGKLLLLCGSRGYTGAAFFAAMGALRSGAGLVFLGVPESIYGIEAVKLNEPVIFPLPDAGGRLSADAVPEILARLPQMDAVLVGPGLGQSEGTLAVVRAVLEKAECPVVVDADGINVLSAHRDLLRGRKLPTILTPHDGEFARLGGVIGEDRMAAAAALAEELGCVVLLKGHETCWRASLRRCWGRDCRRWKPPPAGRGSTARRGTGARRSWGSTECCPRTCSAPFRDL